MRIKILFSLIIVLSILLRFGFYSISPPALYSDEANQGYNAYSLLHNGKDEHGQFLPVSLRSFGDWKPPMQTYLAIPFIFLFGLTPYSVRLPSMILGILSIIVLFSLVKKLKFSPKVALTCAFLLAISPWHLHQSRSAMLVMVAFFCFEIGILYFLKELPHYKNLIFSALFFSLSIYSYYGIRMIVPLAILLLLFINRKIFFYKLQYGSLFIFILTLSLVPLFIGFIHNSDVLFGRAKYVSVFHDRGIELRIWEFTAQEGIGKPMLARFYHNKLYLYFLNIWQRLLSHLDGQFLFLKGDTTSPFRIPQMGVLYLIESIFLTSGLYLLIRNKRSVALFLFLLLILCLLPAALTFLTPVSNRSFNALLPLIIIVAYGLSNILTLIIKKMRWSALIVLIICMAYSLQFWFYLINYYKELPTKYAGDWIYGMKEMVYLVEQHEPIYNKIVILPKTNIAYTYFLFYSKNDRLKLASQIQRDYTPDEFGFEHVSRMGKYIFLRKGTLDQAKKTYQGRALFIGTGEEIPSSESLTQIYYPNGTVAFKFVE